VLRLVTPGTHTYKKFIKPEELRQFVFQEMGGFATWEKNENGSDVRKGEVGETRGIVYNPLKRGWDLWGGAEGSWGKGLGEYCNYMFCARKRLDAK
jgi:polyprenyldihydroxybenzoate methyltransferase/3-demethylubiquinol 3-O-methyltransferase